MKNSLEPEALEDLMTRYVLGDLSKNEADEFEQLLAGNSELAAEVGKLQQAFNLLPYATATDPPRHLRSRILRTAARASATRRPARTLSHLPWSRMVGTIAALLAIIFALDSYRLRQQLRLQEDTAIMIQQPDVVLSFSLKGTHTFSRAVGNVALNLDTKKGAVAIQGLPPLSTDQIYRLWALVGKKHIPCGQFNASAQKTVLTQFPIPVDAYTEPIAKLIVTIEPSAAPLQPVGPAVMISS